MEVRPRSGPDTVGALSNVSESPVGRAGSDGGMLAKAPISTMSPMMLGGVSG